MSLNEKEQDFIIFNTPQGFNISTAFPEFSKKDLPKIECLINQINFFNGGRGYEVHVAKHAWSYCLSNGEVTAILKRLVELSIIKKVKENNPGINSNGYAMVKPYSNEHSTKSFYKAEDYLFIRKLQADKWLAKGAKHSSYHKTLKYKPVAENGVVALQERISQLEAYITANGLPLPTKPEIPLKQPVLEVMKPQISSLEPLKLVENNDNLPDENFEPKAAIELMPGLTIQHFDESLIVIWGEKLACIQNYDLMSGWADRMDLQAQIRLFTDIFKEQGTVINFRLNSTTKAKLIKSNQPGIIAVDYDSVMVA